MKPAAGAHVTGTPSHLLPRNPDTRTCVETFGVIGPGAVPVGQVCPSIAGSRSVRRSDDGTAPEQCAVQFSYVA